MNELLDKTEGPAEIKVDQTAGKLTIEVDITQPISISGSKIGDATGKAVISIDELAIVGLLAAKYPAAQAVLDFLKKEIAPPAPAA